MLASPFTSACFFVVFFNCADFSPSLKQEVIPQLWLRRWISDTKRVAHSAWHLWLFPVLNTILYTFHCIFFCVWYRHNTKLKQFICILQIKIKQWMGMESFAFPFQTICQCSANVKRNTISEPQHFIKWETQVKSPFNKCPYSISH